MSTPMRLIGKWTGRRTDSQKIISGQMRYGNDWNLPNQAFMALKVSTVASGTITAVDTTAAKAISGVLGIITTDDIKNDPVLSKMKVWSVRLLPYDKVRCSGEEVAAVAAEDPAIAEEAAAAIKITYSESPFVLGVNDARASSAPQVYDGTPNLQTPTTYTFGDAATAMKASDVQIISGTYESNMVQVNNIGTYACTANVDTSGRVEIWCNTQDQKGVSRKVASLFGIPYSKARVYIGLNDGGMGDKGDGGFGRAQYLALLLSQKIGRPVHWRSPHEHNLIVGNHRPRDVFNVTTAVKADGTVTAMTVDLYNNSGPWGTSVGGFASASGSASYFYGTYKVPNFTVTASEVYTNTPKNGAYRLPAGPHPSWAFNTHFDKVATALGMNPVDFMKKQNMYVAGDKDQLTGYRFYSIGQPDVLNQCISMSNFMSKWKANPKAGTKLSGVVHGIGIASQASSNGATPGANSGIVTLETDGSLSVHMCSTDIGNSRKEQMVLIAAEMMGLPFNMVTIDNYDSDSGTDTGATTGSSQTKGAGNPLGLACMDAISQMMSKAATSLATTTDKLTYALDGSMKIYLTADPTKYVTFASLASAPAVIGVGRMVVPSKATGRVFDTAVVEVDVDTDTGLVKVTDVYIVQDVGRVICKQAIDGQMRGGVTNAIGQALQEEQWPDVPTGKRINVSHLDHKMPIATQIPNIRVGYVEDVEPAPDSYNFGAKGMGEPMMAPMMGAITCAVANAIGWYADSLPITPDKVLKALGKA